MANGPENSIAEVKTKFELEKEGAAQANEDLKVCLLWFPGLHIVSENIHPMRNRKVETSDDHVIPSGVM